MKKTWSTRATFDRRSLANQAMKAAIDTRKKGKFDQYSPICIYGLCEVLGVKVRFNDINMEGMYQRGIPPRIHLSARRPLPRRAFNCAHELGHHVFGHGSSIDELYQDTKERSWENAREFLAETFAGFMLMPIIGLRRAFRVRGWYPETVDPVQMYNIACEFGVGYTTLLTHLTASVNMLSQERATVLRRVSPKALRTKILGRVSSELLIILDRHCAGCTLDTEVNTLLLLPPGTTVSGANLRYEDDLQSGRLFRAVQPGIIQASVNDAAWAIFVRIAREGYVGLAQYRHMENIPDE